jgi:CBS-domain-containing membrane protein
MSTTVKDVMTTHVVTVRQNATYKDMAARLRQYHVNAVPVVDDENKVTGIVSGADLLTKEALECDVPGFIGGIRRHLEQPKADGLTASDLMPAPAITVGAGDDVAQAARLMHSRRVKQLPVVSEDGHLIGIVSRADVLSVYDRPDAVIEKEITENIPRDSSLVDPARFTITVKSGIVTLEGKPANSLAGFNLVDAVRHMEGVVTVRDRLSYPPVERPAGTDPLF